MKPHDIVRFGDDWVECACGRTYLSTKSMDARSRHLAHVRIAEARMNLNQYPAGPPRVAP